VGIYVAGGGVDGLVRALRDENAGDRIVAVANELTPLSRSALIDGTIDLLLATPIATLAQRAVAAMARAAAGSGGGRVEVLLPAELVVAENA
jgi:LacI family transcriptional regulator